MKIALSPDMHCYYNTYDVRNKSGESVRKLEWLRVGNEMLQSCIKQKVEVLVVPGDFFVNPKPTANEIFAVAGLLHRFEKAGIRVVGIAGNHDVAGAGRKSMDEVVAQLGRNSKWCYTSFGSAVIDGIGFAFLPFVKAPEIAAYNPDYAAAELSLRLMDISRSLKEDLAKQGAKKTILVGHWSIQGAIMSSGRVMEATQTGTETILPLSGLAEQGWDACLFGHIHVPQVLNEKKPFVAYSGCFQRINVGEAGDKRGFYIFDTETEEHLYLDLPAIPIKTFSKEIKSQEDFDGLLAEIKDSSLENKFVYVQYVVSQDDFHLIDKLAVAKAVEEGNPLNIAGIKSKVISASRQREATITETLDNETALGKWMGVNKTDIGESRQGHILEKFRRIAEEIAAVG